MSSSGPPAPGRSRVFDAGSRAYDWLKRGLGVYGTAVTLVQLLPAAVALAAVFLSPTAWLSPTLRRWVLAGSLSGTVAGMVLLASRARPRELRLLLAGRSSRRAKELRALAWWGLGVAVAAGALLRLHLALVDVDFGGRYRLLVPLFDFYLGGGSFAATLYNVAAGVLSGILVAGLVAGGPAALLRWRERRAAAEALSAAGGPLSGLDQALEALDEAKLTITAAKERLVALQLERDELAALTSARDRPAPRAPHAASGRRRR